MNKYHSFYFSELKDKINEVALESMYVPDMSDDQDENNAKVAVYNAGIRDMANSLIDALKKEAEEGNANS